MGLSRNQSKSESQAYEIAILFTFSNGYHMNTNEFRKGVKFSYFLHIWEGNKYAEN